jgi:hypothetical protein
MNFYNNNPIDVIKETFPQTLYSVNFDYEFPIVHKKTVTDRDMLDEYIEESENYGYSIITEEEYNKYNKILHKD